MQTKHITKNKKRKKQMSTKNAALKATKQTFKTAKNKNVEK